MGSVKLPINDEQGLDNLLKKAENAGLDFKRNRRS